MRPRFRRSGARSSRPVEAALPTLLDVTVTALGGGGDGLAVLDGQKVYVRGGLPGERLLIRREDKRGDGFAASIQRILEPSPLRQTPPCPLYPLPGGVGCGGCSLQHLTAAAHNRFKVDRLATALRHAGLDADILRPLVSVPCGQRRRATLAFVVHKNRTLLGFNQAGSHRLCWHRSGAPDPDPIATRRLPQVQFAGVPVTLPVGGFLQPSRQRETTLITLVVDALRGCKRVADLFCGCGTFALPLAVNGAQVLAVEENAAALAALDAAARSRGLPVRCLNRDLDRRPLGAADLQGLDGLVFDPPRAGAMAQAELLAVSGPPRLIAVSCNPATLARDLKVLLQGGYILDGITPVDQFPLTPHLEAVAVLHR